MAKSDGFDHAVSSVDEAFLNLSPAAVTTIQWRAAKLPVYTMEAVVDQVTVARSRIMRAIRQKDTKPELSVRRLLHAMGFRFRLHRRDLPGRPDVVLPRYKTVIFVHGCFWHQHLGCRISNIPRTRTEYWLPKLARNQERDAQAQAELALIGWRVMVVWECELGDQEALGERLSRFLLESQADKVTAS